MKQSISIKTCGTISGTVERIMKRRLNERGCVVLKESEADVEVFLNVSSGLGKETFKVEEPEKNRIFITGGDERGLLYGAGKFIRTSSFTKAGFSASKWRGVDAPEKPVRGMYLAVHFHNFYHDAPIDKIERYIEDMALWGINTLCVLFDKHHYRGFADPDAQKMIVRLRAILDAARRTGLDTGFLAMSNEGYADSPEALRAEPTGRAHYGRELCPYKPGAADLILKWHEEVFEAFSGCDFKYLCLWPYDQGGCGCDQCAPWGGKGHVFISRETSALFKKYFPSSATILSTWLYDQADWEELDQAFRADATWADYILADSHGAFPEFPLKRGVPGNLPLLNFPEISMWGAKPWGGFGANPQPWRLRKIWEPVSGRLSGGLPYSEGIFEDINKMVVSGFYWKSSALPQDIVREYAASEFGAEVVETVVRACEIMEASYPRTIFLQQDKKRLERCELVYRENIEESCSIMRSADLKLPDPVRTGWRWRILMIRAEIDAELATSEWVVNEAVHDKMRELVGIYYGQNAEWLVSPPLPESFGSLLKTKSWESVPLSIKFCPRE